VSIEGRYVITIEKAPDVKRRWAVFNEDDVQVISFDTYDEAEEFVDDRTDFYNICKI
jgi:hypothetical protein